MLKKLLPLFFILPFLVTAQITTIPSSGSGGAAVGDIQAQTSLKCVDAGVSDAYTCTMTPTVTDYAADIATVWFTAGTANTGAATLNIDSVGALPIYKQNDGTDLDDNDIRADVPVLLTYCDACNSTNGAFVISGLGNPGAGLAQTDIDTESELETILTDVSDVFTNNDGAALISYVGVVGSLPGTCSEGSVAIVTDADGTDDCSTGSGANKNLCICGASNNWLNEDSTGSGGATSEAELESDLADVADVLTDVDGFTKSAIGTYLFQDPTATTGATTWSIKGGEGQSATNLFETISFAGNTGWTIGATGVDFKAGTANLQMRIRGNVTTGTSNPAILFSPLGTAFTATSGTQRHLDTDPTFAPTSGTATFYDLSLSPTINQTGGANGLTGAINIVPTLTAAADFAFMNTTGDEPLWRHTVSGQTTTITATAPTTTRSVVFPDLGGNVGLTTGTLTDGNCVSINASGQLVDDGAPCASSLGLDDLADVTLTTPTDYSILVKNGAGDWIDDSTILVNFTTSPNVRILANDATHTPLAVKGASSQTAPLFVARTNANVDNWWIDEDGMTLNWEGATDDTSETSLGVTDPTADRTILLDDASGTLVSAASANTVTATLMVTSDNSTNQIEENAAGCTLDASDLTCTGVDFTAQSFVTDDAANEGVIVLDSGTSSTDSPKLELSRDTNDPATAGTGNISIFQTASGTIGCLNSSDAPCRKEIKDIIIQDPATADSGDVQLKWPYAVTITRISCSTQGASSTATIQFDERGETTPNTGGTDVMTAQLVCDTDAQVTTAFDNAGIAANAPMNLDVDAVANSPENVRIHVEYAY